MAVSMVTEVDRNFLNDNFLENEDWAFMGESQMDDLPYVLRLDSGFTPDGLQYGMLPAEIAEDPWKDISDGSDSGVETLSLKPEPLSPSSLSDTKAEPCSPSSSLFSEASCDSLLYPVPANNVETETCINSATEITQEEWESIQSMLFEPVKSGIVEDCSLNSSNCSPSVVMSDSNPVILSSDLSPSSVAPVSNIQTVTVRNLDGSGRKAISGLGINYQTVSNGHVLNSKVKIQPKPMTTVQCPVTEKLPAVVPASRQIITVTLPALNSPQPSRMPLSSVAPLTVNSTTATTMAASSLADNSLIDVKALKRHQRMIKNRESACLSRKRKKDYMQSLEQQLNSCSVENDRLKAENALLKRKLEQLQTENERLKRFLPVSKTAGAGVSLVLCVVVFLSINNFYLSPDHPDVSSVHRGVHTGRSLLSVDNNLDADEMQSSAADVSSNVIEHRRLTRSGRTDERKLLQDVTELMLARRLEGHGFPGRLLCPTFFNSTESLRLISELEGWVLSHEEELRRQRESVKMEQVRTKPRKKYYPPRRLKAALHSNYHANDLPANRYEVQLFKGANTRYDHFMEAINRRNDTFYVVSFRRDHLLLPATAHNSTMRPRMSVMMPAVGLNATMQPPAGSIAMMQIDCEVTATRLIHIEKSVVPPEMLNRTVAVNEPNSHSSRDWLSSGRR